MNDEIIKKQETPKKVLSDRAKKVASGSPTAALSKEEWLKMAKARIATYVNDSKTVEELAEAKLAKRELMAAYWGW